MYTRYLWFACINMSSVEIWVEVRKIWIGFGGPGTGLNVGRVEDVGMLLPLH